MTTQQPIPYPLRMPSELRATLEERAKANGRSLNQEILAILQHAVDNQPGAFDVDKFAENLAERLVKKLKK